MGWQYCVSSIRLGLEAPTPTLPSVPFHRLKFSYFIFLTILLFLLVSTQVLPRLLFHHFFCLLPAFHTSPLSYEHLSMPIYLSPLLKMVLKLLPQTSVLFILVFSFQLQGNKFLSKLGFFITYVFLPPSHHSSHYDLTSAPISLSMLLNVAARNYHPSQWL